MSRRTIAMTDRLYDYLLTHGVREAPVLARLREETAALGRPAQMQIAPEQGAFMALLVTLIGARNLLEVGTFTGYSALACALALPPGGRLVACDVREDWTSIARRYWNEAGVGDRVDLRLAPARDTLDALLAEGAAGRFDMMFIDADKGGYGDYYERGLRLVRPGGLILVDNTLWSGSVADPADQDADTLALRAFNEKLHADPRINLVLLPIGDGLTMAVRRA